MCYNNNNNNNNNINMIEIIDSDDNNTIDDHIINSDEDSDSDNNNNNDYIANYVDKSAAIIEWLSNCETPSLSESAANPLAIEDTMRYRDILEQNPSGISVTEFRDQYKQIYGTDIDTRDFNGSLIQLMMTCTPVFTVERSADTSIVSYMVYDARNWPKKPFVAKPITTIDDNMELYDIPDGSVRPGDRLLESIDLQQFFDTELVGRVLPVTITTFSAKSELLYGQLNHMRDEFDDPLKQMDEFYNNSPKRKPYETIPDVFLVVGQYCVAKTDDYSGYIRVKLTDVSKLDTPRNKVRVFAIDFGHYFWTSVANLRIMHRKFTEPPPMAIPMRFNGIGRPANTTSPKRAKRWQKSIAEVLFKYRDRLETNENFCQFLSYDGLAIETTVFETDDLYEYYSLNDYLVELRLAKQSVATRLVPDWHRLYEAVQQLYPDNNDNNNIIDLTDD